MRAKLILRALQSLQGVLQTGDFYGEGRNAKEVRGGDDERDVHFMHKVNLSSISKKLVRAEPSVIVSGSNFKASENEKGCAYLGWYPMVY
jgi:hypothetical protein